MADRARELDVDVLVIGWGKGGKTFAATAAGAGRSVAVVEKAPSMYGGTCINIGCVPTKSLIHSAAIRRDDDDPQSAFDEAVAARDALTGKLNAVNLHMLADRDSVTVVDGSARFVGPHEVEVSPTAGGSGLAERLRITAAVIVIDTGAVPNTLQIPGADGPRVHTSTSLQHVRPFPRRLAIIGAGPIGLEFAGMFHNFGSQVTIVDRGARILPNEDEDVAAAVHKVLTDDGIQILTEATVRAFDDDGNGLHLRGVPGVDGADLVVDAALVAVGRRAATEGLGLEAAGVDTDDKGNVIVDDHLRTSVDGVYAMGDVHAHGQQTYLSLDDSRIVTSTLLGDGSRRLSDRTAVPTTVFLTPPLSSIGITEQQARSSGRAIRTVTSKVADIKAMPRPKAIRDPRGIIKFVVDADTDLILGARLFHVDSQEVINLVALAMRAEISVAALRDGIWTHPSSTEALNEVLGQLA